MVLVALSMIFAALLLVANVTAVKIIAVGTEGIDAGILAYPFTFLISDVISEIYGRKITSKIIWMGFVVSLIMVAMFYICLLYTSPSQRDVEQSGMASSGL